MPSHMQEDYLDKGLPIPGDYTLEDIKANDHADALAQEAAKRQQVIPQIASDLLILQRQRQVIPTQIH